MKDLTPIRGRHYIRKLISEGEHQQQDFKFTISDARKIARSLSAFANRSGGRLLIGVKDNGTIAGVRNEEDIYVVEQAAELYCRPRQQLEFTAFRAGDDGAVVIRAEIAAAASRPVQAMDTDGRWKSYYRVRDENILATPLMVKSWRRRASGSPMNFSIGHAEQTLMEMLREGHAVDPDAFPSLARVSRMAAEEIITRFYSLGAIDFEFGADRRFHIVASDPE